MAGSTSRFAFPLISGGSDDPAPDEIADAKQINDGFKAVDAVIGFIVCTSLTRPSTPKSGQPIFETDTGTLLMWNGSIWVTIIATGAAVPTGSVFANAGTGVPAGYLVCNGGSYSRSTYASLFNVIGTQHGAVDATTFNVPNLKGRVPVGHDVGQAEFDVVGEVGGSKTHTLTVPEMPSHSHLAPTGNGVTGAPYEVPQGTTASQQVAFDYIGAAPTDNTGGNQPHNNLQPYMALNYLIKT